MKDFTQLDQQRLWAGRRGSMLPIRLVGIRGVSGPNHFSIYDDIILRNIEGEVTQWAASTDPSWPLVVHAINPDGAAQLCPGVHMMAKHMLHGKFPCLGQAESVHVWRLDSEGRHKVKQYGEFGICIHSGGAGLNTGRFSAGCQIIANPDGYFKNPTWENFWGPIRDGMKRLNMKTVPYMLMDISEITQPTPPKVPA